MKFGKGAKILAAVAVAAAVGYAAIGRGRATGTATAPEAPQARAIMVEVTPAAKRHFEEVVSGQGNLKARNFALVSPRLQGALAEVFVREGAEVKGGETRLFQTDSLKLEKAVESSRQALNVARCSREEKEAAAEATDADYRKAESDFKRYKTLLDEKIASSSEYEEKESGFDRASAMRKHAHTLIALAKEEEHKADTALAMAEKDLKDALVLAPIDGKVSRRMAEPGEMGTPGSPVIRIDDVRALEASAYLPAQYYASVEPGRTPVRVVSQGASAQSYVISYKSPTVDQTLRTFEVKCAIPGNSEWAVPGALVSMDVIIAAKDGVGVLAEAVCTRSGKSVVFTSDGAKAVMVPVETGVETDGWVEVTGGVLAEKSEVITRGQFLLNDGSPVSVQKGSN